MFYNFFLDNVYLVISFSFLFFFIILIEIIQLKFFRSVLKPNDLVNLINNGNLVILDFRNECSFKKFHINNSINVSLKSDYMSLIKKNLKKKVVFIYKDNFSNEILLNKIKNKGFNNIYYLDNGINSWIENKMPLKKDSI